MPGETTNTDPASETQGGSDPQTETVTTTATDETSGTTTTEQQQSPDEIRRELDRLKASLKRANAEAKSHREQATELAKFKEKTEAEKLSENEKRDLARANLEKQLATAQSERDALTSQLREERIGREVLKQASKLNIVDVDAATKLLDWSEIEYDDNGAPTNITDLLKQLVKDKPWLLVQGKAAPTSSGGATNPSRSQTSGNQPLTWEAITQMASKDPEQYNRRRAEINQWMAKNPLR